MIEIAVCDDDANNLDYAVNILHEIFTAQNIGYNIRTFLSANEMLNNIKKIDIGILDIAMNELNGIKLGRKLKEKFPNVKLIYITSYEEYCMQAINDVHAFSFLCKPLDNRKMRNQITEVLNGIPNNAIEKEFYKVTDKNQKEYASIRLKLEDILYFEYMKRQRKAEIVLIDETYECECVFEKLVEELQQYDFVVNRRGNLVNLSHVDKIKGFSIYLDNGKELQIAQKRIVDFRIKMNEFLQKNS
ncbi:MAG: response regulator transcription factor [Lachnospiraceae bacterium]|nr:response regulator transcription factor [Lachnospiraceae bacterium]